eukprot:COSAG06_NODE_11767_length_1467_cov_3.455409_1_plen_207_part_00
MASSLDLEVVLGLLLLLVRSRTGDDHIRRDHLRETDCSRCCTPQRLAMWAAGDAGCYGTSRRSPRRARCLGQQRAGVLAAACRGARRWAVCPRAARASHRFARRGGGRWQCLDVAVAARATAASLGAVWRGARRATDRLGRLAQRVPPTCSVAPTQDVTTPVVLRYPPAQPLPTAHQGAVRAVVLPSATAHRDREFNFLGSKIRIL